MIEFVYRVKYPVKWRGFTLQPGFLVLKDAWNRLYFASGWTCYTYLYVYTAIDGEYVGRWIDVDAIENLPDDIREDCDIA